LGGVLGSSQGRTTDILIGSPGKPSINRFKGKFTGHHHLMNGKYTMVFPVKIFASKKNPMN
jgi:hypothetical protein